MMNDDFFYSPRFYARGRQFRPRRQADPVPYHTSVAAGIKATSHFAPPKKTTRPNRIKTIVPPIDFPELIMVPSTFPGKCFF